MLTSKQLITALEKSDWLDRILILSAFMFFILVVLFILKQRFIDRGFRMVLWWTRFIPLPDVSSKQTNMLRVAEEGIVSLSATVATTTTSLATVVASISSSPTVAPPSSIAYEPIQDETNFPSSPPDPSPLPIDTLVSEINIPDPPPSVTDPVHIEL
jgi:protein transport protein SEC20